MRTSLEQWIRQSIVARRLLRGSTLMAPFIPSRSDISSFTLAACKPNRLSIPSGKRPDFNEDKVSWRSIPVFTSAGCEATCTCAVRDGKFGTDHHSSGGAIFRCLVKMRIDEDDSKDVAYESGMDIEAQKQ